MIRRKSFFYRFALVAVLLAGQASNAQAWDGRDYDWRHGNSRHHHEDWRIDDSRIDDSPRCRSIIKKFRISHSVTVTEKGKACLDDFGNWSLVTPSRYSAYEGKAYLKERGGLVFIGYINSPKNNRIMYSGEPEFPPEKHKKCMRRPQEPDFGWNDKKNHIIDENRYFFD